MKKSHHVYHAPAPKRRRKAGKKAPTKKTASTGKAGHKAIRIGIWDLGAWVAYLDRILDKWNSCQQYFRFETVYLSVPLQLMQGGARTEEAAKEYNIGRKHAHILKDNLLVESINAIADSVRANSHYDQIALITPLMVAFREGQSLNYNYYSVSLAGNVYISAYGMEGYAKKAKRPYEAAIAAILLAQLLAENSPDAEYHDETRGCLFDFNENRDTVVVGLKAMVIEPGCLEKLPPALRSPAKSMLKVLTEYRH